MNCPLDKGLSLSIENLQETRKFIEEVISLIEDSLHHYKIASILEIKNTIKGLIDKQIFIHKDIVEKIVTQETMHINTLLYGEEFLEKLGIMEGQTLQITGRKGALVPFEESLKDIFGLYVLALDEVFSSIDIRKMVSIDFISLIIASVKKFEVEFKRAQGTTPFIEYPYHVNEFKGFEEAIQLLPGKENFSFKYIPKDLGIKFIDEKSVKGVEKEIKTEVSNVVELHSKKESLESRYFEFIPDSHRDAIYSFIRIAAQMKENFEIFFYSKVRGRLYGKVSKNLSILTNHFYNQQKDDSFMMNFSMLGITLVAKIQEKLGYIRGYIGENGPIGDVRVIEFFTSVVSEYSNKIVRDIVYKVNCYDSLASNDRNYIYTCEILIEKIVEMQFSKLFPEIKI